MYICFISIYCMPTLMHILAKFFFDLYGNIHLYGNAKQELGLHQKFWEFIEVKENNESFLCNHHENRKKYS